MSAEYAIWRTMRVRCSAKAKPRDRARYFDRGIRVCRRWHRFENFIADMGPRPAGMTLDRIDGRRGYSPANCRWATPREQAQNRPTTIFLRWRGERLCLAEWARRLGVPRQTIRHRLRAGWSVAEIIETPFTKANAWRSRRKAA